MTSGTRSKEPKRKKEDKKDGLKTGERSKRVTLLTFFSLPSINWRAPVFSFFCFHVLPFLLPNSLATRAANNQVIPSCR